MINSNALIIGLTALTIALGGCVTATVQEIRQSSTGINPSDKVVILGRRGQVNPNETEVEFVSCVSQYLSQKENIDVIDEDIFIDAVFPWFEPRTAPVASSELPELMSVAVLAERFQALSLRYLVWIEGSTTRTDSTGTLACTVAPTGAGCFGFLSWERDSSYEASVWDIKTRRTAGKVSSDAIGTSYMPAVVVPLPFIAPVRSSACSGLAEQLSSFLNN